jgi:hypothetical protein
VLLIRSCKLLIEVRLQAKVAFNQLAGMHGETPFLFACFRQQKVGIAGGLVLSASC